MLQIMETNSAHSFVTTLFLILLEIGLTASDATCDIANADLKEALKDYDRGRPPRLDGIPTRVQTNVYLRELSLHPNLMAMKVDLILRQSWQDQRLTAVTSHSKRDSLYMDQLEDGAWDCLWTPRLHISNARQVRMVESPHRERLIRLDEGGRVSSNIRVQATLTCPSLARHHSTFVCSVILEPYGYLAHTVKLEWQTTSVFIHKDLVIPQYSLEQLITSDCSYNYTAGSSCLVVYMQFSSDLYFFSSEIYGTSFLLVMVSWAGFWLDYRKVSLRLGLGLSIVIILILHGIGFRLLNVKIGIPGNVEVWVAFCIFFVMATLLEYVFAHVLLKIVPRRVTEICNIGRRKPAQEAFPLQGDANQSLGDSTEQADDVSSMEKTAQIIDVVCGVVFPVIFVIFNVIYWSVYH